MWFINDCARITLARITMCTVLLALAWPAMGNAQSGTGVPESGIPTVQTTTTITTMVKVPNWNDENTYWKKNYVSRPYYDSARPYAMIEPAYRYGFDLHAKNQGKSYSDLDKADVSKGWEEARGSSTLAWRDAEPAVRDGYNHVYNDNNTHNSGKTPSVNKNIPEIFPPEARQ